jgi:hypothetical protein
VEEVREKGLGNCERVLEAFGYLALLFALYCLIVGWIVTFVFLAKRGTWWETKGANGWVL